eukprot:5336685-Pleurochrysis_carterae.AAC.2
MPSERDVFSTAVASAIATCSALRSKTPQKATAGDLSAFCASVQSTPEVLPSLWIVSSARGAAPFVPGVLELLSEAFARFGSGASSSTVSRKAALT